MKNAGRAESPPHARGVEVFRFCFGTLSGITPACAGSSCTAAGTSSRGRDHPRVRGEQRKYESTEALCPGSPRVRGE